MSSTMDAVTARRARLGIPPQANAPVVRVPIPPRKKDYLFVRTSDRVLQPREAYERHEEAEVVALHRIAAERWKDVLRETAEKHGITMQMLTARRRSRHIVEARQEACYRLVMELGMSYPATARRVNYFDHTTAMYAAKKHAERHGLSLDRRIETGESKQERDAAILSGYIIGKSPRQLSEQFDLSYRAICQIIQEQTAKKEAMGA